MKLNILTKPDPNRKKNTKKDSSKWVWRTRTDKGLQIYYCKDWTIRLRYTEREYICTWEGYKHITAEKILYTGNLDLDKAKKACEALDKVFGEQK